MLPPSVAVYGANDMAPWGHMYVNPGLTEPIKYLLAMCEDKQQSKSSEIAKRMGKKTNEISSIRAKLLQREVIQAPQRGYVQFAVPDLDIYLRENAAEILERF